MKQNRKLSACITVCYFGLYIIIALSFLIRQPFGSPPDEYNRYLIPQYIYENSTLPNGYDEAIRIPGYGFSYAFQPILPYMFQGWTMKLVGLFTDSTEALVYAARSVDFILGLIMAFMVLLLSKKWFHEERWQWLFAFLITFLPQSIFVHTYVNTDSCCMLSVVLMLYGLTCGLQNGFKLRASVIMSIGIILCALSYYNAYGYILSCILLFICFFLRRTEKKVFFVWKDFLKKGCFIAVLVLFGICWWFIRSAALYDGDFLGLTARDHCASLYADAAYHPETRVTWASQGYSVWNMVCDSDFMLLSQLSFIGIFGAMSIPTSIWIYRFYRLLFFVGVVLCTAIPMRMVKTLNGVGYGLGDVFRKRKGLERFFHGNMVFCILMPLVLSIRYSYVTDFQPQGRYLLPALVPLAYYCVRGIEKIMGMLGVVLSKKGFVEEKRRIVEAITVGGICTVIVICLVVSVYGYVFVYYGANSVG